MAAQTSGLRSDPGSHPTINQTPVSQERGFLPGMLRNPLMSQHATQPPGPSMSPHPLPGGQVHPGMGPMSQHATQPSGPSMSPHPSPGGQVHPGMGQMSQHATQQSGPSMSQHPLPGMGAYQQGGSSGTYGPQSGHYGPQGRDDLE
ncbi:AT-rich interactive domain-containing protein 1B-like [Polyodon spathula]|uniref:AT-rich interactive domain-containing protein 1B-like n=1 Tax=Polyodon spathula TaxID=7913 RepID=UPI001B7ED766|nr:AT-rich interactive domain-containing protein 1B-like [Polyodon spathula]